MFPQILVSVANRDHLALPAVKKIISCMKTNTTEKNTNTSFVKASKHSPRFLNQARAHGRVGI